MKYHNDEMEKAIDSLIHNKVHREILKRRLLDGDHFKDIAEEFNYTERHIKRIVYKCQIELFKHIEDLK